MQSIPMSNGKPAAPVYFGELQGTPSDPIASQYGGYDRFCTVAIGEYGEHKVWFKAGSHLDQLQRGDTIMLDFRSNKFRISKQQPPELIATLQSRNPQPQVSAPQMPTQPPANVTQMPAQSMPAPQPQKVAPQLRDMTQEAAELAMLMVQIYVRLVNELAPRGVNDEAISKLACTVFIQLTSKH